MGAARLSRQFPASWHSMSATLNNAEQRAGESAWEYRHDAGKHVPARGAMSDGVKADAAATVVARIVVRCIVLIT